MENTTDSTGGDVANDNTMFDKNEAADAFASEQGEMADFAVVNTDIKTDPVKQFFDMPELLGRVAQMVTSRKELSRLCGVNRAFDDAFSHELFRHLVFTYDPTSSMSHERLMGLVCQGPLSRLKHTRFISIRGQGRGIRWPFCTESIEHMDLRLTAVLKTLAKQNQGLRSLAYDDDFWLDSPYILMNAADDCKEAFSNLQSLKFGLTNVGSASKVSNAFSSPTRAAILRHLNADYHTGTSRRHLEGNVISDSIRILSLHSLKALAIHNRLTISEGFTVNGRLEGAAGELARLLMECKGLQYLGIRAEVTNFYNGPVTKSGKAFFKDLCIKYRDLGGTPLELKILHLGKLVYMCPYDQRGKSADLQASYLKYLTKTEFLEDIHLWNGSFEPTALGIINPTDMPALRRLYLQVLDYQGLRHLSQFHMKDFLRQIYLSVRFELVDTMQTLPSLASVPYWRPAPGIFHVADFINNDVEWALQPGGLALDFTMWETVASFRLVAPWSKLRLFKAILPAHYQVLSRFAGQFVSSMQSLEFLWISLSSMGLAELDGVSDVDGTHLACVARYAARACPNLQYVGFDDREKFLFEPKGSSRVWKIVRRAPVMGKRGPVQKFNIVEVGRNDVGEVMPVEFWTQDRKMSQFVDGGPF